MSARKAFWFLSITLSISILGNIFLLIYAIHDNHTTSGEEWCKNIIINYFDDYTAMCDLMNNYGADTALPYAMFLADVADSGSACYYVWTLTKDFYEKDLNMDIPEHAFEIAMSYLQKGASNMNGACLSALKIIYEKGKYVPKDLAKAQDYEKLYVTALKGN